MSRDMDALRESLAWYAANGERLMDWEPVVAAAAAYAEGRDVEWCETHADRVMAHVGMNRCRWAYKVDGTKPCRMVRVRVVPYNEEG